VIQRLTTVLFFLTIIVKSSFSQNLNVALFSEDKIKTVIFSAISGEYNVEGDGKLVKRAAPPEVYFITSEDDSLSIRSRDKLIGQYTKVEFTGRDSFCTFRLKPENPLINSRDYDDDLAVIALEGYLQPVNKINIDKYITGVIETEGGSSAPLEFYKAQAILIRTYALKNIYRHSGSGYSLCDAVHCQAYKGKSRQNNLIYEAAEKTKGMVLVDVNNELITTPYHSNCGGMTSNASDVWQKDLPYLRAIKDPFCTQSNSARWTRRITISEWENYLRKNGFSIKKYHAYNYDFKQPSRKKYYRLNGQQILLTKIRDDWNLKSTYFSIIDNAATLVFEGRGFGHGAGLCQEGAIEMARVGYKYTDILHFYFHNVRVAFYDGINTANRRR
jgi:stage II sporulation protein D